MPYDPVSGEFVEPTEDHDPFDEIAEKLMAELDELAAQKFEEYENAYGSYSEEAIKALKTIETEDKEKKVKQLLEWKTLADRAGSKEFFGIDPKDMNPGQQIAMDYRNLFGLHSWNNNPYAFMTLHILVGQLPNIRELRCELPSGVSFDSRVHGIVFGDTASGKGKGSEFTIEFAESLGLKIKSMDEMTTASFVGTTTFDKDGNPKLLPGVVSEDTNILIFTEAEDILSSKRAEHSKNLMKYLTKTMNDDKNDRIVSKNTSAGRIETVPTCSLLLTSYPPTYISDVLTNSGFIARLYLYANEVDEQGRVNNSDRMYETRLIPKEAVKIIKDDLKDRILEVNSFFEGHKDNLLFDDEAVRELKAGRDHLYKSIEFTDAYMKRQLLNLIARFEGLQCKLSMHYAVLNKRTTITRDDVIAAKGEVSENLQRIMTFFQTNLEVSQSFKKKHSIAYDLVSKTITSIHNTPVYKTKKHQGWVVHKQLYTILARQTLITEDAAKKYIELLVQGKELEKKEINNKDGTTVSCVRFRTEEELIL